MKKLISILFITLISLFFSGWTLFEKKENAVSTLNSQNSIAIGKFQLKGNVLQGQYADLLSDFRGYISDSFSKKSDFKVINKEKIDEVLATNGLYEKIKIKKRGNKVSVDVIKKYKETNAQYVLLGEIRNFALDKLRGSEINNGTVSTLSKKQIVVDSYISISLIHVETQEIVANEDIKIRKLISDNSNSDTLVSNALQIMSNEIVSKLLLSIAGDIKVISVKDTGLVINKGYKNGLQKDMLFDIYETEKIDTYSTQSKIATVKINRVDREISFASLEDIIKLPKNGNIAKLVTLKKEEFGKEKIRLSIGDTIINQSNIKNNHLIKKNLNKDMEYLFSKNSAFVVTNNDSFQTDKILAQQLLDEISKGRETGFPLGSLRGVDYLVFSTIDYIYFNDKKISNLYIESIDASIMKVKNATAKMSGYVYLINVNTANKVASVRVDITYEFKKEELFSEMIKSLSQKFSQEAAKVIFNEISPTRIIKITKNSNVILNSGKEVGLKLDDILDVYSDGETIKDDYTGVEEKISGEKFAKVKIIDFTPSGKAIANIVSGKILQTGNQVKLITDKITSSSKNKKVISKRNDLKSKKSKNYIIIKDIIIDDTISKHNHKYILESKIDSKIKEVINKSKIFKTISRNKSQIKLVMQEKQIANSDISNDYNENSMRLSLADFILIPKVTRFILSRKSEKIPYIDSYDNKDNIQIQLNLVLMNTKGEVIYESSKSEKYVNSWASDEKSKETIPSRNTINKISEKLVNIALNDVINNKLDILSKGLLTVIEVGTQMISIDLAENNSVKVGDVFFVYPEPKIKEIKRTGKKRLSYGSSVAEAKINVIFEDTAEAIIISGNINNIEENFVLRNKN